MPRNSKEVLTGALVSVSLNGGSELWNTITGWHYGILGSIAGWWIFREEVAPTTRRIHGQGMLRLNPGLNLEQLRSYLPGAHLEFNANEEDSVEYIIDDDKDKLFLQYTGRQPRSLRNGSVPIPFIGQGIIKPEQLYEWQNELLEEIQLTPDARTIVWYVDKDGGNGKTAMLKHLTHYHGAAWTRGGTTGDIAFAMAPMLQSTRICIIDYARGTDPEEINYEVIENLKDGIMTSNKYKSTNLNFERKHVIVFANFEPQFDKLSLDRWDIRYLKNKELVENEPPVADDPGTVQDLLDASPLSRSSKRNWLSPGTAGKRVEWTDDEIDIVTPLKKYKIANSPSCSDGITIEEGPIVTDSEVEWENFINK